MNKTTNYTFKFLFYNLHDTSDTTEEYSMKHIIVNVCNRISDQASTVFVANGKRKGSFQQLTIILQTNAVQTDDHILLSHV